MFQKKWYNISERQSGFFRIPPQNIMKGDHEYEKIRMRTVWI